MSNKKSIPKYQYGGPGYFTSGNANIGEGTKLIALWILKGLGKVGDAFNTIVTAGASTDFGQTSPFVFGTGEERRNIANAREHTRLKAKETIVKAAPIISPSSHIVAWTNGSLNPYKGAKIIGLADPRLLVLAAGVDIATFAKGPKIVKEGVPAVLERTPIGTRAYLISKELNKGIKLNTKRGTFTYEPIIAEKRIEVPDLVEYSKSVKLQRIILEGTYPMYRGKQHSVKEVVNSDGTINPRQSMRIQHEVSELFPGSYKMEHRLENPEWHVADPTTYHHTKRVAQSAWNINPPIGFTKQDLMIAALGHDFGKMVAGDGHAQIGADLAKQVFPDLTNAQYTAIAEHMGTPKTTLGKVTKQADMRNGIVVRNINGKTRILLPTHTDAKPREIVMEPQENNKYYIHMRVWDDIKNHVPGNISNVEKSNLFQTLYETLPDGAEILFPKSGPENYGTRGTVAGLQRLSRDPRFKPGTPGTLYYKGKNNEVLTYQGTSFIKVPIGVPGTNSMWQVGHHGNYSLPMRFGDIKQGSGLWVKFGEDGQTGISTEGLKTWEILPNGRYKRVDSLKVRQQRLQNKKDAGIIPETTLTTIVRDGEPTAQIELDLVNAYKKLGIEEPDARAMAKYTIANNNEGIHTPVTDDYGNLIGGVSYVDKLKAIAMLKKSGVKNPTEEDIKTIIAHEEGHQVETPGADKEFYTLMGLVLDNEGITAANPNMTLDSMLASIDRYLKQGKLDNGISARRELILDMPINTANRVIANINRFSGGTGVAYLLSDKKDKVDINNLS